MFTWLSKKSVKKSNRTTKKKRTGSRVERELREVEERAWQRAGGKFLLLDANDNTDAFEVMRQRRQAVEGEVAAYKRRRNS